jgi:hypothetical protein
MVITITEKSLSWRGHYLKSRRLNRAVKIREIALPMNSLSRYIALPMKEDLKRNRLVGS